MYTTSFLHMYFIIQKALYIYYTYKFHKNICTYTIPIHYILHIYTETSVTRNRAGKTYDIGIGYSHMTDVLPMNI